VGFAGDYGGIWFLSRLVGQAKARELYYFSDRIDAAEALRLGIVNDVFPDATLQADVRARAQRLADGPRVAYRYMKENFNRSINGDLLECMDMEAAHHNRSGQTADHREAVRAFTEKRAPTFNDR